MAASESLNFENLTFVFAKTMPEIPHEYVKRTPGNEKDFLALVERAIDIGIAVMATNIGR